MFTVNGILDFLNTDSIYAVLSYFYVWQRLSRL